MPKVIYVAAGGKECVVEAAVGVSAMQAAIEHLVPGIDGDCGGAAACGTCHVYVDPAWIDKVGPATAGVEEQMLQLTDNVKANSRLSCQIKLSDALDGLILRMPDGQH